MNYLVLPTINAFLNGTSAVLLVTAIVFIKQKRIAAHKACVLTALATSALFLTCYLIYHVHAGSVKFQGQGWIRPVYYTILISHTLLAVTILPFITVTLVRAFKDQFERHRKIAKITFPLWLYVSVTGVVVYLMLYHLYPSA